MALPKWMRRKRRKIREARLVANPGCYPTGAIGLIRPLRQAGILPQGYPITVNAVSGYTGGGKQMIAQMEDPANPDPIDSPNFLYSLTLKHKHVPEMQTHGMLDRAPIFSPSVGRFPQGMIVQVPLFLDQLEDGATLETIHAALSAHYLGQSIVEVVPLDVSAKLSRVDAVELAGKDTMKLYVFGSSGGEQVNLVALLDNLGKGRIGRCGTEHGSHAVGVMKSPAGTVHPRPAVRPQSFKDRDLTWATQVSSRPFWQGLRPRCRSMASMRCWPAASSPVWRAGFRALALPSFSFPSADRSSARRSFRRCFC